MLGRVLDAIAESNDLAQHAEELITQLRHGTETLVRIRVRGAQQQAVEGKVAAQERLLGGGGKARLVHAIFHRQLEHQAGESAADGVNIAGYRRALGGNLRGLETLRAVDVAKGADAGDSAQVNEFDLVLGDDDVGWFEVVVDHPAGMEVIQGREDLQDVGNRRVDREDVILLVVAAVLEGGAADVFHDDEAAGHAGIIDEVNNLDDIRVGNIRQELALRFRRGGLLGGVLGLHALEHDDASGDKVVVGQVNPAQAAVGEDAEDFVLLSHHVPGLQLRRGDAR